jgi:hypothetical protein
VTEESTLSVNSAKNLPMSLGTTKILRSLRSLRMTSRGAEIAMSLTLLAMAINNLRKDTGFGQLLGTI